MSNKRIEIEIEDEDNGVKYYYHKQSDGTLLLRIFRKKTDTKGNYKGRYEYESTAYLDAEALRLILK